MLLNLLTDKNGYYYKNLALASQIIKLETQTNRYALFDVGMGVTKYCYLISGFSQFGK